MIVAWLFLLIRILVTFGALYQGWGAYQSEAWDEATFWVALLILLAVDAPKGDR